MKKLLCLLVLIVLTLPGCKKSYICDCQFNGTYLAFPLEHYTHSEAKDICDSYEKFYQQMGTCDCELQ